MFSNFYYETIYFLNEHSFITWFILIVGIIVSYMAMKINSRLLTIISVSIFMFSLLVVMRGKTEEKLLEMIGRSIYDIDYIAELVESGSITEEQAKKYLPMIASHNEKSREEWLQEKKQEGEKKYKEIESRIKTKEIQKRLEDEYKKIVD